jgi:hypothetical protein
MAMATPCQTSGAQFHIKITDDSVTVSVDLPFEFTNMSTREAMILEANLHNAVELVLAPYFVHQK